LETDQATAISGSSYKDIMDEEPIIHTYGERQQQQPPRVSFVTRSTNYAKAGVGFGSALAITISWSVNHSITWAVIHGFFSWAYVLYFAFVKR